jgi:ATP-dependent DNA ligase
MPRPKRRLPRVAKTTAGAAKPNAKSPPGRPPLGGPPARRQRSAKLQKSADAPHAFVGGWSQRSGDFLGLLLGVREGRRRKLTYVGEVSIDPKNLATSLLEPRLREGEVETCPFVAEPPQHSQHTHHWIEPTLVAEIEFDGWTKDGTIRNADLKAAADRTSFREPRWIKPKT